MAMRSALRPGAIAPVSPPIPRKCAGELVPVPYRGVERDTCSRCQGVWLDFGELDQMLAEGTGFLGSIRRIFT